MTAEEKIKRLTNLNLTLLAQVYQAREDERRILAGELHDKLSQQLAGLKMDIFRLDRKLQSKDEFVMTKLTAMLEIVDAAVASIRSISAHLHPEVLEDLGLSAAMEWYGKEFTRQYGINVFFGFDALPGRMGHEVSLHLYRIYQHLLDRSLAHSGVRSISASVQYCETQLVLTVRDDGRAANEESDLLSTVMQSITERVSLLGGECSQECEPNGSPMIRISIPRSLLTTSCLNPIS